MRIRKTCQCRECTNARESTIDGCAWECAREALAAGAAARALDDSEDAARGDYQALVEALGRETTSEERVRFRAAFSAALASGCTS